jgi:hypothetical protein
MIARELGRTDINIPLALSARCRTQSDRLSGSDREEYRATKGQRRTDSSLRSE